MPAIVSNQFRKQLLEQLESITRKNYIIIVRLDLRRFKKKKKKAELSPNMIHVRTEMAFLVKSKGTRARSPGVAKPGHSLLSRPQSQRKSQRSQEPS